MGRLLLPPARIERWVENFIAGHGETDLAVVDGALTGRALDGSVFAARLPFSMAYDGPATPSGVAAGVRTPPRWGVLLVRKGGFAVARLEGTRIVESKVGQRHVQGRTKAGGQSQQRFARRRENQARQAYEAAAEHAARILTGLGPVATGGDRSAVDEVMSDPRLRTLEVVGEWQPVPDPRRAVLDEAIRAAQSLVVTVENA